MKKTLVTIVVLTYKKFDEIEKCINSIFSQSYENIELIIHDDCSPNFDIKYIEDSIRGKKERFVDVIIKSNYENMGTVVNFNEAIKLSSGDIIMPLSADDVFNDNEVVSKVVNYFDKNDVLICTTKRLLVDAQDNEIETLPTDTQIKAIEGNLQNLFNVMCEGNLISGACTYYKKEVFKKYGLFDTNYRLMEDYPFYLKLIINNEKIGFLDYISIRYGIDGVSSSENLNPIYVEDWKRLYKEVIFKNKEKLSKKSYRTAKLDYIRYFYRNDKTKYYMMHIKYLDITLAKGLKKIL